MNQKYDNEFKRQAVKKVFDPFVKCLDIELY
jgi:transposase-like protein